jgi:homopolymeric O-antigen transport system permease protein
LPSEGVPYAVFVFAGLATWTYFSSTISKMATSLDGNMQLITKIYFPRVVLPASVMVGTLVDFAIVLPIVLITCVVVKGLPIGNWMFVVPAIILMLAVTFGVGLWLAALNARYRDVILALPVVLQIGIYLTPVIYSASIVSKVISDDWLPVLAFVNPMIGVVELFRWATLATDAPQPVAVLMACVSAAVLIATGGLYFAHTERNVVDRI